MKTHHVEGLMYLESVVTKSSGWHGEEPSTGGAKLGTLKSRVGQVSSSTLDRGSKLRGPSPEPHVLL
ncbi:hypothetical protein TNCV_3561621 [Trichonephila clavipes]|nr:hypothetical protein TNCV_3561621 [Trichonephila clavipes]